MEISATSSVINSSITPKSKSADIKPNAFGIGNANQAAVELSPQAKILQQTELSLKSTVASSNDDKPAENEENKRTIAQDFVRVSSSIGKGSQSNALTSEQALDIYRSIEQYL